MSTQHSKTCQYCGRSYTAKNSRSAFCSDHCRIYAHRQANGVAVGNLDLATAHRSAGREATRIERRCLNCGKAFVVNGKQGRRLYCSEGCKKARAYKSRKTG